MLIDILIKRGLCFEENSDGGSGQVEDITPNPSGGDTAPLDPPQKPQEVITEPEPTKPEIDVEKLAKENKRLANALAGRQKSEANLKAQLEKFNAPKPEIKTIDEHPALRGVEVDEYDQVDFKGTPVSKEFYVAQMELQEQLNKTMEFQRQQVEAKHYEEVNKANSEIVESTIDMALSIRNEALPLEGEAAKAADQFVTQIVGASIQSQILNGIEINEQIIAEAAKNAVATLRMVTGGIVEKQTELNNTHKERYPAVNDKGNVPGVPGVRKNAFELTKRERQQAAMEAAKAAMAMD